MKSIFFIFAIPDTIVFIKIVCSWEKSVIHVNELSTLFLKHLVMKWCTFFSFAIPDKMMVI